MSELPDFLEGGEVARLIPVGAANQRERVACSVLLASLRVVQPFARSFFSQMNWRFGNWAQVHGYIEPVFRSQPEALRCRPDGLLVLNTGRREGRFIVETKIGGAKIDTEQLGQYCQLVRSNEIDAIITISNELSPDPSHLPYAVPKEARNVKFYHWSWSYLVMLAELLLRDEEDFDEEQDYILREIIRYFDHQSTGVARGNQMCTDWAGLIERIQVGSRLTANDPGVLDVIQCWHQQLAGICIDQARNLKSPVALHLSRSHWDQPTRLAEDVQEFVKNNRLLASFEFPTPLPIDLIADARRRNITYSLNVGAPLSRRRYGARVRWLLNQLPEEVSLPVRVNLLWERGHRSTALLSSLREDLNAARLDNPGGPRSFEITYVTDLAGRFAGCRNFLIDLEDALTEFHEMIARHIQPWRSPAAQGMDEETDVSEEPDKEAQSRKGERKVTKSGTFEGKSYSIFNDGSIEIETDNGLQHFKDFSELRAAAARKADTDRIDFNPVS
jgi:hypothetical protein